MSAIITDQFRILSANNFVTSVASTTSAYYTFIGLPNATDLSPTWNTTPPSPKDSFSEENDVWDTLIALKKITTSDVRQVIRKITWTSGTTYDMYRHDITRDNLSKPSNSTNLYDSNFYVMNSEYKVYICLQNGTDPENTNGRPSLDEPNFVDLEPRSAGSSGDGYIWKYLYTMNPGDIIKFDSIDFIPVPTNWATSTDNAAVRNNAGTSGQLKIVTITNRGVGLGTANKTYTRVPIKGNGSGAEATIIVGNDSKIESINISRGGSGYTFGIVDLVSGNVPTGTTTPRFDVIVPPQGGHGKDIYRELGASNVLIYSRIENDIENPDFITGNQIARVGIVQDPKAFSSTSNLNLSKASGVYALRLIGAAVTTFTPTADSFITQTVGVASTAVGRVISYDNVTGVLKYWQDKSRAGFTTSGVQNLTPQYGLKLNSFTSTVGTGGSTLISNNEVSTGLRIDTSFTGITTVINNRTYNLGQSFINGVAQPEVEKYSGNIIYIDNRPSITRSSNQKEDIKVILQF